MALCIQYMTAIIVSNDDPVLAFSLMNSTNCTYSILCAFTVLHAPSLFKIFNCLTVYTVYSNIFLFSEHS